jgi:hypothetical protein
MSLYDATSPLLSDAMEVEEGRVTRHVLPYDYLRLTPSSAPPDASAPGTQGGTLAGEPRSPAA